MGYIYEADDKEIARLRSVRVLFEDLAQHKNNDAFDHYFRLLHQAQHSQPDTEIARSSGPTALWSCHAGLNKESDAMISYVMVNDIHVSGIAAFTALTLERGCSGLGPQFKTHVHAYMPEQLLSEASNASDTPMREGANRAINLMNMLSGWHNRPAAKP